MSFMDVMYGPLGQVNNQFQNNLANNAAGMNYSNNLVNSWQNVPQVDMTAWSQATNANAKAISDAYIASNLAIGGGWGMNGQAGGGGDVWSQGAPAYQDYGGGANPGGFSPSPNYPGGGGWQMGADGQSRYTEPTYNAPMSYGWQTNEGASYPAYQPQAPRGEFNAQTYGWDHNEGAPPPNQGQQDFLDTWGRALPVYMPPVSPSTVTAPGQQSWFGGGGDFWSQYNAASAAAAGSMGSNYLSPGGGFSNSGADPWGGGGGGYDMSAQSRAIQSPLQGFDWGQSYGTRGGQNADMLRAAGGASSGYYDPQLDWMSQFSGSGLPSANPNYFDYSQFPQGSFSGYGYFQPQGGGAGLSPQDMLSPHAYPPEVRSGWTGIDASGQNHYVGGT